MELLKHGTVRAEQAEGFEMMAWFVRDVFAVQAVDVNKMEVHDLATFLHGTVADYRPVSPVELSTPPRTQMRTRPWR